MAEQMGFHRSKTLVGGQCPPEECRFGQCVTSDPNNAADVVEPPQDVMSDTMVDEDVSVPPDVPEEDAADDVADDVTDDVEQGDVEQGCQEDGDCGEGEICQDEVCREGCRADEDCGEGEICLDLSCEPGCRLDEDCGEGELCRDDACVPGCLDDEGCSPDEYCELDDERCEQGCRVGQCPQGQVCQLETRQCAEVPCEGDESCDVGQICEDELCIDGCRDDNGCGRGEICEDDLCVPGCRFDIGCSEGEICLDASCVAGCRADADCGALNIYEDNLCVPGCRRDSDCLFPEICEENACALRGCQVDEDCPTLTRCGDGQCVVGCRNDSNCGDGEVCDGESGLCRAGCRVDEDCASDAYCAEGDLCEQGCRGDSSCGDGQVCDEAQRQCVAGCRVDEDCASDAYCAVDELLPTVGQCEEGCRLRQCPQFQACDVQTRRCLEQDMCFEDDGCGEGLICEPFFCVQGCRDDGACPEGQICDGEGLFCRVGCREDAVCPRGQYCETESGLCASGCRSDEECGLGRSCLTGDDGRACVPTPCDADEGCDRGFFCDVEGGVCEPGCRSGECPQGQECDLGVRFCVDERCQGDEDCQGDEVCRAGVCEPGCRDDAACAEDQYCVLPRGAESGVCQTGCRVGGCEGDQRCDTLIRVCAAPSCQGDDDCDEGEICRDGVACTAGCRGDGDCPEGTYCDDLALACVEGCRVDDDGDDQCEAPTLLDAPLGEQVTVQGSVCLEDDPDHLGVELVAGERLVATLNTGDGLGVLVAEVLAPGCEAVVAEQGFEGDPRRVGYVAEVDGLHVLRLRQRTVVDSNTYGVDVVRLPASCPEDPEEPNNVGDGTTPPVSIERGRETVLEGRALCLGDEDWYAVPMDEPGDALRVSLTQDPGDAPLTLEIVGEEGEVVLAVGEEVAPGVISAQTGALAEPGRRFVRVSSSEPPPSGLVYDLSVLVNADVGCVEDGLEPNDTPASVPLVGDGVLALNLCQGRRDQDWLRVNLQPGDTFNLTLDYDHSLLGGDDQLGVSVYGPGGLEDLRDFTLRDGDTSAVRARRRAAKSVRAGAPSRASSAPTWFTTA